MKIHFPGIKITIDVDAIHVIDCYGNNYYLDDSIKAIEDKELFISKYDDEIDDALYPAWITYDELAILKTKQTTSDTGR